jgi:hypothetical protein
MQDLQNMKEFHYQHAKHSVAPFYGDESTAVSVLKDEFVALRDRNASEDDLVSWRNRIPERFPEHEKEQLLQAVRDSLGGNEVGT